MCSRLLAFKLPILGFELIVSLSRQKKFPETLVMIPFSGNISSKYRDIALEMQLKMGHITHFWIGCP